MKVLVIVALLVACTQGSVLDDSIEKSVPSFATGRIINGEDAVPHSAPYIVSLSGNLANHGHNCGGSILSRDWIITAAHCFSRHVGVSVIAGLHVRAIVDENTQRRVTDFGKNHDQYAGGVGPYDIAILHVSEPFVFNEFVKPAVIPVRREIHSGETVLYGWGKPDPILPSAAQTLQTVTTQIVPWATCKQILPTNAPLHETNLCSDSLQQGISACNGDSGGPLVKEYPGAPAELIGIVSWGYTPCGQSNRPSIYTRVSHYIDWIAKIQKAYYVLY